MVQTKICAKCKETKPLTEFYNKGGKNGKSHAYCKICGLADVLMRQRKIKINAVSYKGGSCNVCGYSKYTGALEFHHIDPSKKDFHLAKAHLGAWEKIQPELDKCVMLCANCHREIHAGLITVDDIKPELCINQLLTESTLTKREKIPPPACVDCGKIIKYRNCKRCMSCSNKRLRTTKIDWPSREEILERLKASNYTALGRELGVTDNTIRKYLLRTK